LPNQSEAMITNSLFENWYYSERTRTEGWLCPALFKYFAASPREIYAKAEPK
jgi:hypothetical protein